MSSYQPGIPTGSVPLAQDYLNIQGNFQQLDTTFGVDHTTFSNQTAQNGYHKAIHLIPQAAPAAVSGYGQLFTTTVNDGINNDQTLYYISGGGHNIQLTRNLTPSLTSNGYTCLPGGLILQWGNVLNPGSAGNVTFPIAFPTACFNVQLTYERAPTGNAISFAISNLGHPSTTGFSYFSSTTGSMYLYWLAIGY